MAVAACGLDVPIEGEELLRVVLYPFLCDEFVTYQPEHTMVCFHLGNLLCHGLRDSCSRESLCLVVGNLLESLCLGGPSDHLMNLGPVHPVEEAGLAISLVHLLPVEMDLFPVHHSLRGTYSHHE